MSRRRNQREYWGGGDWFAVPVEWTDAGVLHQLGRTEIMAALKLARHADFTTGKAYPGADQIGDVVSRANTTKARRRSADKSLAALADKGIARKVRQGGGRGNASVYQLLNPRVQAGDSDIQTPACSAPIPRPVAHQTPAHRPVQQMEQMEQISRTALRLTPLLLVAFDPKAPNHPATGPTFSTP